MKDLLKVGQESTLITLTSSIRARVTIPTKIQEFPQAFLTKNAITGR
jgi:hypothetical protein